MTCGLYDLRVTQLGLSDADLDRLTMGQVSDMFTERVNDDYNYAQVATTEDYMNF